MEIAGSGHNDVLAICCLLAAQGAIIHKKDTLSICFIALSAALKLLGVGFLPLFARAVRARALLLLPVVLALCSWPYRPENEVSLDSLRGLLAQTLSWRANYSLFHVL